MKKIIQIKIDQLWESYWGFGISNGMEFVQQTSYLMMLRGLEKGDIDKKQSYMTNIENCKWSSLLKMNPEMAYEIANKKIPVILERVFAKMHDIKFKLPSPHALRAVMEALEEIYLLSEQDQSSDKFGGGEIYEYMLSKLTECGRLGQFRTPRHIIDLMCRLVQIKHSDQVCDPACGTAGFLIAAANHIRKKKAGTLMDGTLYGYEWDDSLWQLAKMNLLHHGIQPAIGYSDALFDKTIGHDQYTKVLCNPPFSGKAQAASKKLRSLVDTLDVQPLFLALCLRILKKGGQCACVVPQGTLFKTGKHFRKIREELVERHRLEAVVSMPSGVFKPYSGLSTAILIFTKTGSGETQNVWFYDMRADGYSLNNKRVKVAANDIPDILARFNSLEERKRSRHEQSFLVPKQEIAGNDYVLTIQAYQKPLQVDEQLPEPLEILQELQLLEVEIQEGLKRLEHMILLEDANPKR